ncbi:MAG: DUF3179 domain-containing protein [Prolixibacteraceae bacterium]|nr:DUF3179 domain-containing protein [Prolixibacteraceae bacterium]
MKTILIYLLTVAFLATACGEDEMSAGTNPPGSVDSGEWLIPKNEVRDGGPGRDGIPALSAPQLITAQEATFLTDNELVLGFADGSDVRAYPHDILDWHEIINDETANHSIAVIYCPLTGTGIGWDRNVAGTKTTFGVSGLLYNSNIIPYDRSTNSNWSQLLLKSVNGELIGTSANTYNLVETSWKTWKQLYPSTKVVSTNTGHNRNYGNYPYGNYKTSGNLLFPVSRNDNRLDAKERVLGVVIGEKAKAYRFENFPDQLNVINDTFEGTQLVVAGSKSSNLMVAFDRKLPDGTVLDFQPLQASVDGILQDNEGNKWDVFGRAVAGLRTGQKLTPVPQMMGYWFSFPAFYPDIEL